MSKLIEIDWIPSIHLYTYYNEKKGFIPDPNITEEEILNLCISEFKENYSGKKSQLIGHSYTSSNWNSDVWNHDINQLSHVIENIWIDKNQLKATLNFFDFIELPKTETPIKFIGKVCHSQYVTRLTKIDVLM